jgi:hypothetical protein
VIVFRTLPHLVMESAYRHRAPVEPYLLTLIALGVVVLVGSAIRSGPAEATPNTS